MIKFNFILVSAVILAACSGYDSDNPRPRPLPPVTVPQPEPALTSWQIGPWMGALNYSKNCPLNPTVEQGGFKFDVVPCEPHYVTGPTGPLTAKKRLVARFRIAGAPGTIIYPVGCAIGSQARIALYFQELDVNWSKDGYRWWQTNASRSQPLQVNTEFELAASLTDLSQWKSVMAYTALSHPQEFAKSKANAGRAGFTLGGCKGAGHGIYATGPVTIHVSYRAE